MFLHSSSSLVELLCINIHLSLSRVELSLDLVIFPCYTTFPLFTTSSFVVVSRQHCSSLLTRYLDIIVWDECIPHVSRHATTTVAPDISSGISWRAPAPSTQTTYTLSPTFLHPTTKTRSGLLRPPRRDLNRRTPRIPAHTV